MATEAASSQIDRQTIARAVDSLLKWLRVQTSTQKSQLFEQDEPLRLILSLKKIPSKGRLNPFLIPLPNPLLPATAEICLIADDRKESLAVTELRISSEGIPISQLIPLSSLKSDYKAYEARRKLCGSFDIFVADRSIIPLLPRLIGNSFFKKKKHPLPIDISRKGWPEQLKKCLSSATLYFSTGTCCQLDVGRASQGREEIIDNVVAAIDGALDKIPKKWGNIRSIHLKFDESVALPIFRALPEMGFKIETRQQTSLKEEESTGKKEKKIAPEELKNKKRSSRKLRYMDVGLPGSEVIGRDEEELKMESPLKRKQEKPDLDKVKKKVKDEKSDADISQLAKKKKKTDIKAIDAGSIKAKTKLKKKISQKL